MSIINDNWSASEDIFQEFDTQELQLRRSQRILEKKNVDPNNIIPPNQADLDLNPKTCATDGPQLADDSENMEETPDFTHLHATVELNEANTIRNGSPITTQSVFETPLDLSIKKDKCIGFVTSTPILMKENQVVNNKENAQVAETFNISVQKIQRVSIEKTSTEKNAAHFQSIMKEALSNPSTTLNEDTKNRKTINAGDNFLVEKTQNTIITLKQIQRKSHSSISDAAKSENLINDRDIKNRATRTVSKPFESKQQRSNSKPKTEKQTTAKRRGRKRLEQTKVSASPKTQPISDYVPPKIMRYYNSCQPVLNGRSSFPSEYTSAIYESMLPPVYPPHFKNQIVMPPPSPPSTAPPCIQPEYINLVKEQPPKFSTLPISLLTPENSEIIAIDSSNEDDIPLTALNTSPLSLHNFFETDELNDIFDLEKPVFELTELHVRSLAVVLNIDNDLLFQKLADIAKSDNESLRKLLSVVKN